MLRLPNVTLIALTNRDFEGHKRALDKASEGIEWGARKIIWDESITGIDEWSKKIFYELGDYVQTDFALLIHADGWVVHPEVWNEKWLGYDYIGSPWPAPQDDFSYRDINNQIQRVGNSVSLRSKKLLDLPKRLNIEWKSFHGYYNEDGAICVNYRHIFEQNGCIFAPLEVAKYFGREHEIPENQDVYKTFVFHDFMGKNKRYENDTHITNQSYGGDR